MMYCYQFKQLWPLKDALYLDVQNRSLYACCPVCCAHGVRASHIVWGSLAALPSDMATINAKTAASEMATVGNEVL